MNKPVSAQQLQKWFLLAMVALAAIFLLLLVCGNLGDQTDIFYMGGRDFQADMLHTEEYARELNPYGYSTTEPHIPFKDANYPPQAYVLFYLCDLISGRDVTTPWAMAVSVGLAAIGVALLFYGLWQMIDGKKNLRILLSAALALSAPALFAFERGNIILLCCVLCIWFLLGYRSQRPVIRELALLALAIAAALKIFPALLGLLLIRERAWKDAFRLILYGIAAVFLPFFCVEGGFSNLPLLIENFGAHTAYYTRFIYPRFGFRLFASMTYDTSFANTFLNDNLWRLGDKLFRYMPAVDAILACCCLTGALVNTRRWEAVAAIMLVLVNYPVNSGYYTALYLLPAIAMLLSCPQLTRKDIPIAVLFLIVLCPVQIPIPYASWGITDPILCNLTGIFHNLAAYALFFIFAFKGVVALVSTIRVRGVRKDESTMPTAA